MVPFWTSVSPIGNRPDALEGPFLIRYGANFPSPLASVLCGL